jgi:hypothetical protein
MNSDILIIADSLLEPPSEPMAFRMVTMVCHDNLSMECLFTIHFQRIELDLKENMISLLHITNPMNRYGFTIPNGIMMKVSI